jgi:hypothetical protein
VAEIERKVVKRGKRSALSRFVLAKGDKDKIAAWNRDLDRVLHIFNVRLVRFVWYPRIQQPFQTELAIGTHIVVTDTQAMVSNTQTIVADIHRNVLTIQEGASGQNHLVGATCYLLATECLPSPRLDPG